jgi:hypothetical protein
MTFVEALRLPIPNTPAFTALKLAIAEALNAKKE